MSVKASKQAEINNLTVLPLTAQCFLEESEGQCKLQRV